MSLTKYTTDNVTSLKQLTKAVKTVFGAVSQRNEQIQQLLLVSVAEAARESGGQVTNNLAWLSNIIAVADNTKGVNAKRIVRYVVKVLCNDTVSYNSDKKVLSKKKDKTVKLDYNTNPDQTWYEFEKSKDSAKAAFDYGKRGVSAMIAARNKGDNPLSLGELFAQYLANEDCPDTIQDLMEAMEAVNPLKGVA